MNRYRTHVIETPLGPIEWFNCVVLPPEIPDCDTCTAEDQCHECPVCTGERLECPACQEDARNGSELEPGDWGRTIDEAIEEARR